jgi:hypothetical protein
MASARKAKQAVEIEISRDVIAEKRDGLVSELQRLLLTKTQMIRGKSTDRNRSINEFSYQPVLDEINELGKQLGLSPVGFSDLRRN